MVATLLSAILLFFTIPLAAFVAHTLFHDKKITALTVLFYSLSPLFLASMFSLYNPTPAFFVAPVLLLFLWKYIHVQKPSISFFIGILFGLLIQFNFQYVLFLSTLIMYFWYFKLHIRVSDSITFLVGLLISVSSFIVADIKFGGRTVFNMIHFFTNSNTLDQSASQIFLTIVDKIISFIYITFLPFPKVVLLVVTIAATVFLYKELRYKKNPQIAFLLIWLSNILMYASIRSDALGVLHTFNPSLMVLTILGAALFVRWFSNLKKLLIFVVMVSFFEVLLTFTWRTTRFSPMTPQQGIYLQDEISVIDNTYQQANGKPFTIRTYTNPLGINTLWAYLYRFYGERKYGYVPYWEGIDQKGYLGDLPQKQFATKLRFVIIEPDVLAPKEWLIRFGYKEDLVSNLIEEKKFGEVIVQKRMLDFTRQKVATPSVLLKDPAFLNNPIDL